ncbi:MAG: electron transfer flavoprotein subunit alpha [Nocardioides sp.]|uniref:hypothetical protein n=1 Tax=Nocardioides sp. TaxID=35761 RepID=UPI0026189149|nr:hypothetical protein [Nocardioides sp.]MCW2833516.1 electron transfer flavoprotein subunit alpha [Nocardioides sp.]
MFFGSADKADAVAEKVKAYGAAKVSVIDDAGLKGYLVAPKAEAMAQRVTQLSQPALPRSRPGGVVAWVVRATDKAGNVTVRRGIRRKG